MWVGYPLGILPGSKYCLLEGSRPSARTINPECIKVSCSLIYVICREGFHLFFPNVGWTQDDQEPPSILCIFWIFILLRYPKGFTVIVLLKNGFGTLLCVYLSKVSFIRLACIINGFVYPTNMYLSMASSLRLTCIFQWFRLFDLQLYWFTVNVFLWICCAQCLTPRTGSLPFI